MTLAYCTTRRVIEVVADKGAAPSQVLIFRAGIVECEWRDGGYVAAIMDESAAGKVIANFAALGHEMVFDYEHQSEGGPYSSPDGLAPAAGWITGLEWKPDDGLYATVRWNERAKQYIEAGEYKYHSPVFVVDKDDGNRIVELHSVALTNTPATIRAVPLAAANKPGAATMIPKQILTALGLTDEATEQQCLDAIASLKSTCNPDTAAAEVAKAANLPEVKTRDGLVKAIAGLREPNPAKYVPVEVVTAMRTELDALKKRDTDRDAEAFVADGMKAGKIVAGTRDMWRRLYAADAAQAKKDLESAPVIVATGTIFASGGNGNTGGTRADIIAEASAEYDANEHHLRFVSKKEYVAQRLREENEAALSKDEESKFALVG